METWISVGTPKNWEKAISEKIWGVRERLKKYWDKITKGDLLFIYASSPISGIIGVVRINNKFKQDKPLWSEEIKKNKVIWPYRYDFEVEFVLPKSEWESKKISTTKFKIRKGYGLSRIVDKNVAEALLQHMDQAWNTQLSHLLKVGIPQKVSREANLHDKTKEMLLELGKIEGYIPQKEYEFPDTKERIDVVWRRVPASVPTYVFEVQIGGNMHQALSKLKHAHDLWNSNIFLISEEADIKKINQLLSGAFHEIKDLVKILTVGKIQEIHELQVKDDKLKREVGFR